MSKKQDEKALEHAPHNPTPSDHVENPPETKLATDELTPEAKAKLAEGAAPELPARRAPGTVRGTVWEHGAIHHDGEVYAPGTTLDLPEKTAAQLGATFIRE